ncbi:g1450 [Coccomyxa elongata]
MGFALVYEGANGVTCAVRDPGAFPPYKGVVAIILTWFIAPVLTGLVSAIIFLLVWTFVLRRKYAYTLSFWLFPLLVLITVFINIFFVFTKGAKKSISSDDWSDGKAAWIAFCVAAGLALLTAAIVLPILKRYVDKGYTMEGAAKTGPAKIEEDPAAISKTVPENNIENGTKVPGAAAVPTVVEHKELTCAQKASKAAMHGINVDIHHHLTHDDHLKAIHDRAEIFEPKVEYTFKYLQVFSAICVIFAHGAGEVGYMAGPLATIWDVYQKGELSKSVSPPVWVILIVATGLVVGLATYGYNVTRAMGVQLAKLTPTRGFSAELATSFTIMIAAQYGLPTSSSQCITGAVIGVGICENINGKGVNWRQFLRHFASWVATLFLVGFGTAAIFAQGVYAPSIPEGREVMQYENRLTNLTTNLYKDFNTTLWSYRNASASNVLPLLPPAQWDTLNKTVNAASTKAKRQVDPKYQQSVAPDAILDSLYKAIALYQQNTVFTLGQNTVYNGSAVCNNNDVAAIASNTLSACKAPGMLPTGFATKFP